MASGSRQSGCSGGVGGDQPSARPGGADVDALAPAPDAGERHRPGRPAHECQRKRLRRAAAGAVEDAERIVEAAAERRDGERADHRLDALVHEGRHARVAVPPARTRGHRRRQVGVRAERHPGDGMRALPAGIGDERRTRERPPLARAVGAPVDEQRAIRGHPHGHGLPVALVILVDPRQAHRAPAGHGDAARRRVPVVDERVHPVLHDDLESRVGHARVRVRDPAGSGAARRVTAHDARVDQARSAGGRGTGRTRASARSRVAARRRTAARRCNCCRPAASRVRAERGARGRPGAVHERRAQRQQLVGAGRRVALVRRAARGAGRSARRSGRP